MFRHERPQKGRYRQFYQVGVEAYGMPGPDIDIELIQLTNDLWKKLEINELKLHLNTLGNLNERAKYKEELIKYLKKFKEKLDEDSIRRLDSNPLRILDSKNPETQNLIEDAPSMLSFLGKDSRAHFNFICNELESLNISYLVDTHLVRGLDYYSHTVFEWKTDLLGSQGTICAGGRYDGLVSQLGGQDVPAIGFALGMERLVSVIDKIDSWETFDENQKIEILKKYVDEASDYNIYVKYIDKYRAFLAKNTFNNLSKEILSF